MPPLLSFISIQSINIGSDFSFYLVKCLWATRKYMLKGRSQIMATWRQTVLYPFFKGIHDRYNRLSFIVAFSDTLSNAATNDTFLHLIFNFSRRRNVLTPHEFMFLNIRAEVREIRNKPDCCGRKTVPFVNASATINRFPYLFHKAPRRISFVDIE